MDKKSLWFNFTEGVGEIRNPKKILTEQLVYLEELTQNLISGYVEDIIISNHKKNEYILTNSQSIDFSYAFIILSKYIEKYIYAILKIQYSIKLYPVFITLNPDLDEDLELTLSAICSKNESGDYVAKNEAEYEKLLSNILGSYELGEILKNMMVLAQEKKEAEDFELPF
ncbi:hypothetical protein DSECCO2_613100 [anaerobic digester metagenome]